MKMRGGLDAQGNLVALDYEARAAAETAAEGAMATAQAGETAWGEAASPVPVAPTPLVVVVDAAPQVARPLWDTAAVHATVPDCEG